MITANKIITPRALFIVIISITISSGCILQAAPDKQLTGTHDPALQIVNKKTSLGHYQPNDLVDFDHVRVSKRIVKDLKKLLSAAKKAGLQLKAVSGYRSYDYQIGTFERWVKREMIKHPDWTRAQAEERASHYSARAGHSEHQIGTTVDILSAENGYQFSADKKWKYVGWLEKNASKFNFKISYPEGSEEFDYEPWHLRWYPPLAS